MLAKCMLISYIRRKIPPSTTASCYLRHREWILLNPSLNHLLIDTSCILAIIIYFSKWVVAIPLKEVKTTKVIEFIKHHLINHFGIIQCIINDNQPKFWSQLVGSTSPVIGLLECLFCLLL